MAKAKKKKKKVVKPKSKPKKVVKAKAKPKAKPKKVVKAKAKPKAKPKKVVKAKAKPKAKPKLQAKAKPVAPKKPTLKVRKPVVYVSPATIPPAKIHRRDGAGHLDPDYAERLLELSGGGGGSDREDEDSRAFVGDHEAIAREPLSRELGREVIEQATTGEYVAEDNLNAEVEEEEGGPFVPSTDAEEVAHGTDESNPKGAKREPFPKTSASADDDD